MVPVASTPSTAGAVKEGMPPSTGAGVLDEKMKQLELQIKEMKTAKETAEKLLKDEKEAKDAAKKL